MAATSITDIYEDLVSAWNAACDWGLSHNIPTTVGNAKTQSLYTMLKVGSSVVQRVCECFGAGVERDPNTFKLTVIV